MPNIHFSRMDASHIEGFLTLQEENLLSNIEESEHEHGFVTTPFTAEQLQKLIKREHVFVALDEDAVIGYIVCASWQYLSRYPIFEYMVSLFDDVEWKGRDVTDDNSYQYGPVCLHKDYRGRGILIEFFQYVKKRMAQHYPYAMTFVNTRNKRSANAHMNKLQLDYIQEFRFKGQRYHMLGFET